MKQSSFADMAYDQKKGNTWHFGMKTHVGREETIYADKAHADQGKKERAEEDGVAWRVLRKARRGKRLNCCDLSFNRKNNRTRARVEHPFGVIKHLGGYRKVRDRAAVQGRGIAMRHIGALLLGLVVAWSAACGNDDNANPVSTTPAPGPPDGAGTAGNVVFTPGSVDSTAHWGADAYELESAAVTGDTLVVTLSYGGGCRTHRLTLVAAEGFMESDPVRLQVAIAHDADGDPCQRWVTEDYHFLLDPIKARYKAAYGSGAGVIVLQLARNPGGPLDYQFD